MAAPYFLASNFWAFCALVLMLGRSVERTQPMRYAFFGWGGWHTPFGYHLMVAGCIAAALACLWLHRRPDHKM